MTETISHIPRSGLTPSPLNPRKHLRGIDALAESLRRVGVQYPLIVRAVNGHHEIADGWRRWLAAEKAEIHELPCIVREMTDTEVIELMVTSSAQNEHLHPLDEADGYAELMRRGYDVPGLAAKTGRDASHIRQRLKLLDLGVEARAAFIDDQISVDVAFVVARVPVPLQGALLPDVVTLDGRDPSTAGEASRIVRSSYTLRIADAPFDQHDSTLVPEAGACTTCPKRTSVQAEMFADLAGEDLCTDAICFRTKCDAELANRKALGAKVLASKAAKDLFVAHGRGAGHLSYSAPYVDLNAKRWDGVKERKVSAILGKDAPEPLLAQDSAGHIFELVPRALLDKALGQTSSGGARHATSDEAKKAREKAKLEAAQDRAIAAALAEAAKKQRPDSGILWHLIGRLVVQVAGSQARRVVGLAHALEKGEDPTTMLEQLVKDSKVPELQGLVIELLLAERASGGLGVKAQEEAAAALSVDLVEVENAVGRDLAAKKKTGFTTAFGSSAVTPKTEKPAPEAKTKTPTDKKAKAGKKAKPNWSPEAKANAAERMRQYWAARNGKPTKKAKSPKSKKAKG